MKTVSVVVINHNFGEYVASAISSILNQTWLKIEVIVVDDGSNDNSRAIISEFGDRVIKVFQENRGHTCAVNTGFSETSGKFVLFLDADDLLYPTAVASALSVFQPNDVKVQFQLDTIDRAGVDQKFPFPYFEPGFSPQQVRAQALTTGWYPWTTSSGNLYSRKYLQQIMPLDPKRVTRSPDSILNKLAPLYGDVRTLRQVLGAYRVHGRNSWASTTQNWTPETAVKWLELNQEMEVLFLEHARNRGIPLKQPLVHPFQKLEYEVLVHRFFPHEGVAQQSLSVIFKEGWRWLVEVQSDSLAGRIARMLFLTFLAVAPRKLLKNLLPKARGQINRHSLFKYILGLTRKFSKSEYKSNRY